MTVRPILLLGMHRSGTSCLAGSLQQRGLYLGEVYESRPHNRKGNRENQRIMDLNNAVLAASDARWDRPPPAGLRWDTACAAEREAIVAGLEAGSAGAAWGFKDPRTLLTLPFWRERLPDARLVATFRHPARVARSLHARDPSMSIEAGLALWAAYNERLLAVHAREPFPIVSFDADAEAYAGAIDRLARHIGLRAGHEGDGFFEGVLRHQDAGEPVPAKHQALYEALAEASKRWIP